MSLSVADHQHLLTTPSYVPQLRHICSESTHADAGCSIDVESADSRYPRLDNVAHLLHDEGLALFM